MKNLITYLKALWSWGANSQSSDVSHDCRLTVGSPSGMTAKLQVNTFMRFAVVLTLIFTIGVGNVWGATATFTASDQGWSGSSTKTQTVSGVTFSFAGGTSDPTYYSDGLRTYEKCVITISSSNTITGITFTYTNSNSGTLKSFTTGTWTSGTKTWSGSATTISCTVGHSSGTKNGQVRITEIVVTYTPSAASHTLSSAVSPAESGSVELSATSVAEGSTATATATPAAHYVFDHWSISGTGSTLSSTTDNPTTITMGTANTTVTATFVAVPKASVTLSEAGATTTDATTYYVGDSYTLPSSTGASCGTKVLVGWSTVTVSETDIKPASNFYETGETVTLEATQTFYAVFATASGGGGGGSTPGSKTLVANSSSKYYVSGYITGSGDASTATWTADAFTMTQNKNNSSNISLSYDEIRVYASHSLVFTPASGTTITSIVATAGSNAYATALGGSSINNCTKEVSESTVTITPTDGTSDVTITNSAQSRLNTIVVNYTTGGGTSYSAYSTTCQACVEPTNPTNTSITAYGATIGWTGGGTGTLDRYEYAVWMDGDDEPTSGFTSNGTNTSNALTGLLSNTTYRWKVRKVCTGGDGESMWLKSSFTTSNVALTFSVPTGASAVLGQNSDVALPSAEVPTNCGDCWAFVGWTTAEHAESSSAPAKLFASDAIVHLAQADGSTLYAVYKKDEFKLIKATSQMENNGYYVLTSLHESHEYAMTNVLNGKYATSTDVTSLISEPEVDNYLLKNPSESTIWKFTGTASSGRFYNESSGLYLDLTEKEGAILKSSTTDNLVITIPNVKELAFDIASVAESSHYLYMWTSHQWSVDNAHRIGTDNSAYLYKRISLVYATTPSCPIYTVTWDVNGASTSTTEVTKCEGYLSALPGAPADNTLSGCQTNGKFMGWSASKVMPAQDIAPADIFSEVEDAPEITEDVTFYAVFANGVAGAATPVNTTYTFNSKLWGDATNSWSSNTAGSELTSERGIQILGNTSAEGITKNNYTDVTKVVVTYCTNASSGAGSVTVTVGDTEFGTNSISKPSSGGATLKTFTYTHAAATGKVKISASASSSSIYIYSVQIYYTGAGTVYEQYRTACCNDPGFSFTGENDAPVTEYVIVRENMASASDAVEIDCNYTSSNTTGAITWYSTRRAAKTFPSTGAYTWTTPTEQPTNLNIDLANKKIAAKETGVWTITISQADGGTTYCPVDAVVTVRVKTVDKFIDNVNGNFSGEAQRLEDVGNGITLPTETTFTINGGCSDGVTRRLVGWIKASDLATYASGGRVNKIDDWKTADPATNKVIAPGTKVQATGVTWYAVWGVEK